MRISDDKIARILAVEVPAIEPRLRHVLCADPTGLHRVGYAEWGDPDNPRVLLCVHGLTRTGRDFDTLAQRLSDRYRVVCPDMPGRGRSDWLRNPNLYAVPQYVADCVTLIARTGAEAVDWVGTSMGGLIGMTLASLPDSPIRRLVLNDIGPVLEPGGLQRIGGYVGASEPFATREQGLAKLRELAAGFGPHTDAQWAELNRHYLVERDGRWTYHYDPAIATPFRGTTGAPAPAMWPLWDAIACPVLALRGEQSDLLSHETLREMAGRGPRAAVVEVVGVGHAPTLMTDAQIEPVRAFLQQP